MGSGVANGASDALCAGVALETGVALSASNTLSSLSASIADDTLCTGGAGRADQTASGQESPLNRVRLGIETSVGDESDVRRTVVGDRVADGEGLNRVPVTEERDRCTLCAGVALSASVTDLTLRTGVAESALNAGFTLNALGAGASLCAGVADASLRSSVALCAIGTCRRNKRPVTRNGRIAVRVVENCDIRRTIQRNNVADGIAGGI